MEPQRPTMAPALQEFLSAFAEALGSPDSLRLALEVASTGLMTSPRELGGILINLHEAGKISERNFAATIGEVVAGKKPGRTSPTERLLCIPIGTGAMDIAVATVALQRAGEKGLGGTFAFV